MKITLVRHGETDWNAQHKLMGRADIPLNSKGIAQAHELVKELADTPFDAIYTSPLLRAKQTADIIGSAFHMPLFERTDLFERNYGTLAGSSWAEVAERHTDNARDLDQQQQYDYTAFGGERAAQVQERLEHFLAELKSGSAKCPLVVCHGGIIRMLQHLIHGRPEQTIEHGAIHTFEI